ncbi:hypothetical protein GCM10020221_35550 [Streptomyces thioluteus]|uniref:RNA polymerase sigma-70 region 4 domain-containing protein n=1 Tax=Streptomyces thioluteus TaxID=66431 RepID=A0ABN3X4U4_STRTU
MPTVVGEIKRFFAGHQLVGPGAAPGYQELRLALTKASDELAQKLDPLRRRCPSSPCAWAVSEEDAWSTVPRGRNAYTASSLDSPSPRTTAARARWPTGWATMIHGGWEGVEYRGVAPKPLLAKLPPRTRQIIMLRCASRTCTQSQIGEEVGISQMHVSRLLTADALPSCARALIAD